MSTTTPGITPQFNPAEEALKMRKEAAEIINRTLLKLPPNVDSNVSERLVECLVAASMFEITDMMQKMFVAQKTISEQMKTNSPEFFKTVD
jgi:hypothetical protein